MPRTCEWMQIVLRRKFPYTKSMSERGAERAGNSVNGKFRPKVRCKKGARQGGVVMGEEYTKVARRQQDLPLTPRHHSRGKSAIKNVRASQLGDMVKDLESKESKRRREEVNA